MSLPVTCHSICFCSGCFPGSWGLCKHHARVIHGFLTITSTIKIVVVTLEINHGEQETTWDVSLTGIAHIKKRIADGFDLVIRSIGAFCCFVFVLDSIVGAFYCSVFVVNSVVRAFCCSIFVLDSVVGAFCCSVFVFNSVIGAIFSALSLPVFVVNAILNALGRVSHTGIICLWQSLRIDQLDFALTLTC